MKKKITIINTGGTFNKIYNPISGELEVSQSNVNIEKILQKNYINFSSVVLKGIIFKDSLEMNDKDRAILKEEILQSDSRQFLIIHGTDTMDKSAQYLDEHIKEKEIVFVGAMEPYSINETEASGNLMLGYGFLRSNTLKGVYIAMHGNVKHHTQIIKNREKGIFECL